jgi:hypothetical protein
MAEVTPHRIEMTLEIVPPEVHFFKGPVRGRPPFEDKNFILTEQPDGYASHSIANVQDFYITPSPTEYILPMWLYVPDTIFGAFDVYHTVTVVDQYRPDLISYRYYNTVGYWWVILLSNDVLDPFNIKPGTILRIPSADAVLAKWIRSSVKSRRRI